MLKYKRNFICLFSVVSALSFSLTVFSQPLNINTGFTPPVSDLLHQIMELTFSKAGIEMSFSQLPAERSIALVARGIDDAECCRIPKAIEKDYPDLVRVPEIVYIARFSAFAKKPLPDIKNFESLKPYSVATVSGWKILVNNLNKVNPEVLHIMESSQSMFQILQKGRIDIATYGYLGGLEVISSLGLNDISVIEPPLATAPLYLYLNEKHKHLVPRLVKAIKELKEEGKIEEIISRFENR